MDLTFGLRQLRNLAVADKWRTIAAITGAVLLGVIVLLVANRILDNKTAIEKSCILLNNVVIRSQSEQGRTESTNILLKALVEIMTPTERERYQQALRAEAKSREKRNPLLVNCDRIVEHPEEIKAIQIKPTR